MATYHAKLAIIITGATSSNSEALSTIASYLSGNTTWRAAGTFYRGNGNVASALTTSTAWTYVTATTTTNGDYALIYRTSMTSTATSMTLKITSVVGYNAASNVWANTAVTLVNETQQECSRNDGGSAAPTFSATTRPKFYYYFMPQLYKNNSSYGGTSSYAGRLYYGGTFTGNCTSIYNTANKVLYTAYTSTVTNYLHPSYNLTGLTSSFYELSATSIYCPAKTCTGRYGVSGSTSVLIAFPIPFDVLYNYKYQVSALNYQTTKNTEIETKDNRINTSYTTRTTPYTGLVSLYSSDPTNGTYIHTGTSTTYMSYTALTLNVTVSGNSNYQFYYPYASGGTGAFSSDISTATITGYSNHSQSAMTTFTLYAPYYYNFAFYNNGAAYTTHKYLVIDNWLSGNSSTAYYQHRMMAGFDNGMLSYAIISSTTATYSAYTGCGKIITGTVLPSKTRLTSFPSLT